MLEAPEHKRRYDIGGTICFLVIYAALFILLLRIGPLVHKDTHSYLNNAPIYSPVYPYFLQIYDRIFGDRFLEIVVFSQLLLGFGACLWLAHSLRRLFSLPNFTTGLLAFILLLPYLLTTNFGNTIFTEGLAYPMFLLAMKFFLTGMRVRRTSQLVKFLLMSVLLVLTRRQFYILYPLFAIALIYIFVFSPAFFRKFTLLFLFVFIVAATQLAEMSIQYFRDGHFAKIPFTGFHLVSAPLFLSKQGDAKYLATEEQRILFTETHERLAKKGLLVESPPTTCSHVRMLLIDHFRGSYNAICWGTLLRVLHERGVTDWYKIDELTRGLSLSLIRNNLRSYLNLIRLNIIDGAGGGLNTVFLLVFTLLAWGYHFLKRDGLSLAAAFVSTLHIGNLVLIALAEPVLTRYTSYTIGLQICIYSIVAVECFRVRQYKEPPV